jgi:hypothetical protein
MPWQSHIYTILLAGSRTPSSTSSELLLHFALSPLACFPSELLYILQTVVRTPWTGGSALLQARYLHKTTHTEKERWQTSMPRVVFESTTPVFERAKTVHVLTAEPLWSPPFIHSSMFLQPFVGPWPLFQFRNLFYTTVGLLGRVVSPLQGRYLHTGQHKHTINSHIGIHAFSGIRTHDPSLRPRGHCDRHDRQCHN